MNSHRLGVEGELKAIDYLKSNGYVILEKNYRALGNEVDIICEKKGIVVFVEVKMRNEGKFGTPMESVTLDKTGKIIKTARYYLQSRNLLDKCEIRFDVIGVQGNKLEHIEDAFRV